MILSALSKPQPGGDQLSLDHRKAALLPQLLHPILPRQRVHHIHDLARRLDPLLAAYKLDRRRHRTPGYIPHVSLSQTSTAHIYQP